LVSTNRLFALILALVVAALIGLLLVFSNPSPDTYVVRAMKPIPAASPVQASQIEAIPMDDAYIEQGAFTASSAKAANAKALEYAKNQTLQYPLSARQQLTKSAFATDASLGQPLGPDERLMSVRASAAAAAAGTLQVGDSVDVVFFNGELAGMVASNVSIVAIAVGEQELSSAAGDQLTEGNKDKSAVDLLPGKPIPGTFLLRVKMHQITPIAASDGSADSGRLYLVQRGEGAQNVATVPMSVVSAICGKGMTPEDLGQAPAGTVLKLPAACAAADDPGTIISSAPAGG
jgi:Flp pilus assembly protein CpaB